MMAYTRIARILHDDVLQQLMAVVWKADNLGLSQQQVEDISAEIVNVADSLRKAIAPLSPHLERTSLSSVIDRIPAINRVDISPAVEALPADRRRAIYYTVYEIAQDCAPETISLKIGLNGASVEIQFGQEYSVALVDYFSSHPAVKRRDATINMVWEG